MRTQTLTPHYSHGEEIANSLTHGLGAILSIGGLGVLTAFAAVRGDAWHMVSCSIFGASLILMYTASTLYHSIQSVKAKSVLRIIDHCAIFVLIAGTYTPFTLVSLRGPWGWWIFSIVWLLAILGVVFQVKLIKKAKIASLILYVGMGWIIVLAIKPLMDSVPAGGLFLLFLGGFFYTSGILFYVWRRLPYHHAIWHISVLSGSVCHFFAILFFVIPPAAMS